MWQFLFDMTFLQAKPIYLLEILNQQFYYMVKSQNRQTPLLISIIKNNLKVRVVVADIELVFLDGQINLKSNIMTSVYLL